jgi:hypothetical protein
MFPDFLQIKKLPESLEGIRICEPSIFSRCWKFTSKIGSNPATISTNDNWNNYNPQSS